MKTLFTKFFIFNLSLLSLCFYTVEVVNADLETNTNANTNIVNNTESIVDFSSGAITPISQTLSITWNTQTQTQNTNIIPEETTASGTDTPTIQKTFFVVTAYYSPLPNQQHYLKGNYEDEVILNGKWIRGASGKNVFPWMLAAPKSYAFGTKIYLEWIGIWEVSDRGGAIVSASGSESRWYEYDRIDIWVGSGEEGLKRALAWGKKVVPWYVMLDNSQSATIQLEKFPAPDSVVKNLVNKPKIVTSYDDIFSKKITPESSPTDIKKLQLLMYDLWLQAENKQTGAYDDIKNILIDYQLSKQIIGRREDEGAGYFGPKTSASMKDDYISLQDDIKIKRQMEVIKSQSEIFAKNIVNKIGTPRFWEKNTQVKYLQASLKLLWKKNIKTNGKYDISFQKQLTQYQLDKNIISSSQENGAGVFGPKTKQTLQSDLTFLIESYLLKKNNLLAKS